MMGSTSLYNLRPQLSVRSQPFVKLTLRIYYTSSLISIYPARLYRKSQQETRACFARQT